MGNATPLIAVLDDESSVRTMLRRALRMADYEVVAFATSAEFLASLPKRLPRCVILDVHLSDLSGFDVESRMRAANVRIPVIFITASDDAELDRSAAAAEAVCLLRKPFSSESLLAAVREALGGPRSDA